MRELDLESNKFGDDGGMCLAICVHKIDTLNVCNCDIGSRGVEALACSIREMNRQVKMLNNVKLIIFLRDELKLYKKYGLTWKRLDHLINQHASHCMGKMSESDFGFDRVRKFGFKNSESEPIERNCRFDHLSAKHFRLEDSAPEPIQKSVFSTPFRPCKGNESDQ